MQQYQENSTPDDSLVELESRLADALGHQAAVRVELAKAEFSRDARRLGRDLAPIAAGVPLLIFGYVLANLALALALAPWLSMAGGLALLGAINLLGGGLSVHASALVGRARPSVLADGSPS